MGELDLTLPRDATSVTPCPAALAGLRRLHAAAADPAETAPEIIADPDATRGLEQRLIEAMVDGLAYPNGASTVRRTGSTRLSCASFAG